MSGCHHVDLTFEPSSHAAEAGFVRKSWTALLDAAQLSTTLLRNTSSASPQNQLSEPSIFPQPLVLPRDELAWDPEYEPQDLKSWLEEPERNEVRSSRRTLYVVDVPSVSDACREVGQWSIPVLEEGNKNATKRSRTEADSGVRKVSAPIAADLRSYLTAFYYPMKIKPLPRGALQFVPWTESRHFKTGKESYIGLRTNTEIIGIRHRPSRDGIFPQQLNLNDLLDAAMSILPKDAYALLLLVDHDIYEDEDDDFCCGRAYGGSRVAVVSSARYNPILDERQDVEREHAWPASHCAEYVQWCCDEEGKKRTKRRKKSVVKKNEGAAAVEVKDSPMHAAVKAFTATSDTDTITSPNNQSASGLWFSRVCKTASHELGHCFGIDHCVFFACVMQGTAGLSEDARQPPYLCPVDLAKVLRATGADEKLRYAKLREFCQVWGKKQGGAMWRAWEKWLEWRIKEKARYET